MNDAVAFPLAYGKEFAVEVAAIFVDRSFAEECVHHDDAPDWRLFVKFGKLSLLRCILCVVGWPMITK